MSSTLPAFWPATLIAVAALNVSAQPAPAAAKPSAPAASAAAAPATGGPAAAPSAAHIVTAEPATGPFVYRSVFEGYQRFADENVQSWKQSNETVRAVGGWRAYAKEAADVAGKDNTAPAPAPAASAAQHGGSAKP